MSSTFTLHKRSCSFGHHLDDARRFPPSHPEKPPASECRRRSDGTQIAHWWGCRSVWGMPRIPANLSFETLPSMRLVLLHFRNYPNLDWGSMIVYERAKREQQPYQSLIEESWTSIWGIRRRDPKVKTNLTVLSTAKTEEMIAMDLDKRENYDHNSPWASSYRNRNDCLSFRDWGVTLGSKTKVDSCSEIILAIRIKNIKINSLTSCQSSSVVQISLHDTSSSDISLQKSNDPISVYSVDNPNCCCIFGRADQF